MDHKDKREPDVIILCGGAGKRLQTVVSDRPKPLAEIEERPFLDILLEMLLKQGFRRVILAVGHMKEKMMEQYSNNPNIVFSTEDYPLGTGGAVKKALGLTSSENIVVMNGDSYCYADLRKVHEEHLAKQSLVSMVLTELEDVSDRGSVALDDDGKISSFEEKIPGRRNGLVNGGIYIFNKEIIKHMPDSDKFSLELDLFPRMVNERFYGYVVPGGVLDIGTPERYALAKEIFAKNKSGN